LLWLAAGCAGSTGEPREPEAQSTAGATSRPIEASMAFAAVGQPAPDFELPWMNHDGPGSLAELRGRVVLLEFWRST
jgi:hypothetical protein